MTGIIRKRGIVRSHPRKRELMDEIRRIWVIAQTEWPAFRLNLGNVPVVFVNCGTTAGYARWHKNKYEEMTYNIEINVQAITVDWHDTFSDTIPHEVAHVVNRYLNGRKVKTHGPEWKRIAIALGSTGERTHCMPLKKVRNRKRLKRNYVYEGRNGIQLKLTSIRHNKLQSGKAVWYSTPSVGKVYAGDYVGQAF